MQLIYCYDAYCGWCYGFRPIINKIAAHFKEQLYVEVISGGMVLPQTPTHISATASYIKDAYKIVEQTTSVQFGQDYLWHINNPTESDWYPNSEKPAIALAILKDYFPEQALAFASDLQIALYKEGRDLTDDEAYRHLLEKYNIPEEEFYSKLKSEEFKEKAQEDFLITQQLKITGFPTVFLQTNNSTFHLLAQGYTTFDELKNAIDSLLSKQ
jgi:putative protein-disulfide isomerase